jgi:hypothetical protein
MLIWESVCPQVIRPSEIENLFLQTQVIAYLGCHKSLVKLKFLYILKIYNLILRNLFNC